MKLDEVARVVELVSTTGTVVDGEPIKDEEAAMKRELNEAKNPVLVSSAKVEEPGESDENRTSELDGGAVV